MKKFRFSLSARSIVLLISAVLSVLFFLLLTAVSSMLINRLLPQQMAERWSDKKDVSQISCFFSGDAGVNADSIEYFRHSLDAALMEASIVQDSPNAGARLWADAYSASGRISLSNDRASLSADAIGIGGDFFLFHPLKLLDGSYFSEDNLNQDHCILDEDAAWQLFGSNQVAGMTVMVGGVPHIVAGVIEREDGRLSKAAGLDGTLVYVSWHTLETLGQSNGINHYEIVMPNPVKNYAFNYVRDHIGVAEDSVDLVENTGRFDLLKRFRTITQFGTRSMNRKAIIYPYWENVARGYEDIIALITLFAALFLAYPTVLAAILAVRYFKHKTWTIKSILHCIRDKCQMKMEELRAKKQRIRTHGDMKYNNINKKEEE